MANDSTQKTIIVALLLCLVCSILVSAAAVLLRPEQVANRLLDKKRNILDVAGLLEDGMDIEDAFQRIEGRVIDLNSGGYINDLDAAQYDQRAASQDPEMSVALSAQEDIAKIRRRPNYATVYHVKDGEQIKLIILPVYGYGLWSTLYGFLALEPDGKTIRGLKFYEHAETPGLGGEVDNAHWRAQWEGKLAFDDAGQPRIEVVRGRVDESKPASTYQVDGLAGATLTSQGVTNLLRFWLGEKGFTKYLQRFQG